VGPLSWMAFFPHFQSKEYSNETGGRKDGEKRSTVQSGWALAQQLRVYLPPTHDLAQKYPGCRGEEIRRPPVEPAMRNVPFLPLARSPWIQHELHLAYPPLSLDLHTKGGTCPGICSWIPRYTSEGGEGRGARDCVGVACSICGGCL
jgi:hypothetical protein